MDVSIIIVNWNTCKITCDCLDSIYTQGSLLDFEVILVDNASSDDSVEVISREFPQVKLIANNTNRGFAAANNQGIIIATGEYVLLLNSDTIVLDKAIDKTYQYFQKLENVAVVGCQVWEDEHTIQKTCFKFYNPWILFCVNTGLAKLFRYSKCLGGDTMLYWDRKTSREVDVVSGMFMMVKKEAISQIGLLDEAFFIYCEEADWCYRFKKAGWKNLFWTGAKIVHLEGGGKSSKLVSVKMETQKVKSILIYIGKHFGILGEIWCRMIFAITSLVKLSLWVVISILLMLSKNKRELCFNKINKFKSVIVYCFCSRQP